MSSINVISKHLHFKTRISIECNIIGKKNSATKYRNKGIKRIKRKYRNKGIKFVLSNCIKSRKIYHWLVLLDTLSVHLLTHTIVKNPTNSFENKQYYPVYNFFFLIIEIFLDKIFWENIRIFSSKKWSIQLLFENLLYGKFLIQIKQNTKFLILIDITELNSLERN